MEICETYDLSLISCFVRILIDLDQLLPVSNAAYMEALEHLETKYKGAFETGRSINILTNYINLLGIFPVQFSFI